MEAVWPGRLAKLWAVVAGSRRSWLTEADELALDPAAAQRGYSRTSRSTSAFTALVVGGRPVLRRRVL
jgi:hypothetical protein